MRRVLINLGWLIGSLVLAVLVWYAAVNQQNPVQQDRYTGRIPVEVLKDEMLLVVRDPLPVQVVIRAPRSVWNALNASDIVVTADLRGKPPGKYTIPLTAHLTDNRQGAISEIQPNTAQIELVKRSEQSLTVNISASRAPPVGFEMGTVTLSDNAARVIGSEEVVQRVVSVVARVDLSNQTRSIERTLALTAIDAEGRTVSEVTLNPQSVEAKITIQPRPGVTVMKVNPKFLSTTLQVGYLIGSYSTDPAVVAVRGDRTVIEGLNGNVDTEPINLIGKNGSFTQTVKLALPAGVSLTDPVNVVVSVEITTVNTTREFTNIAVQPQGLDPADFLIAIQPQTVNVIVRGPLNAVNSLQASQITVIAPLAGLGGGVHTVTLVGSVAHDGLTNANLSIPNPEARVTISALRPTLTPTSLPATRTPTLIPVGSVAAPP